MNLSWFQGFSELVNKLSMPWTRSLYNAIGFAEGGVIRGLTPESHQKGTLAVIKYNQDLANIEGWRRAEEERMFFEE